MVLLFAFRAVSGLVCYQNKPQSLPGSNPLPWCARGKNQA